MSDGIAGKKRTAREIEVEITPDSVTLLFLARAYRLDLEALLCLYEVFGSEVFLLFALLAGRQLVIPKHAKLLRIRRFAESAVKDLASGRPVQHQTLQERDVGEWLARHLDEKTGALVFRTEMEYREAV